MGLLCSVSTAYIPAQPYFTPASLTSVSFSIPSLNSGSFLSVPYLPQQRGHSLDCSRVEQGSRDRTDGEFRQGSGPWGQGPDFSLTSPLLRPQLHATRTVTVAPVGLGDDGKSLNIAKESW